MKQRTSIGSTMGNTTWVTQGKKEITMDTVSCKHCVCKNVCTILKDLEKLISNARSPHLIISGVGDNGETRNKLCKILSDNCTEFVYDKRAKCDLFKQDTASKEKSEIWKKTVT